MTRKPNIILMNCDDLGYGDIACYGSKLASTPTIDKMASEGIKFTDFYMAASVCSPSRAAMLTGSYPLRIGFDRVMRPGDKNGLNPNEITIAKLLQDVGYSTSLIGKWHLGDQSEFLPLKFGFDSYYGLPYSNDMGRNNIETKKSNLEYPDLPNQPPLPLMVGNEILQQQPDQRALTERYVDESLRFIRDNQNNPFFLYFAHMYTHRPQYVPKHALQKTTHGAYVAAVEQIDWSLNMILSELKALSIEEDTLVIFTSDNGASPLNMVHGASNEPLRGGKGTTWEGGHRLPCIMKWKGHMDEGKVCSELVTAMDYLPTIAKLSGAKIPTDRTIDGKDISHSFQNTENFRSPHEAFYYYRGGDLEAVRQGKWKLRISSNNLNNQTFHQRAFADSTDGLELFDLETDISESENLAKQNTNIVKRLELLMEHCRIDIGDQSRMVKGNDCRPIGQVNEARPLTEYDPDHPYMISMYDLDPDY